MSASLDTTPREDGFRMPAEFEPHAGCWMLWPERADNWRAGAGPAQHAFAAVAAAIARFEPVSVGASTRQYQRARGCLPAEVRLLEISSNDAWMRDCGPTFVTDARGEVRGVDWEFNAWGGLYADWDHDSLVAQKVLEIERIDRYRAEGFVLEGGAIHVDGQGTLITTEECLLNPNRNPHLSQSGVEAKLQVYLGVETVIWLPRGVFNDETSGHVDNLCCFVRPGVVALSWTEDRSDPQYNRSGEAYERLVDSLDAQGRRLAIHKVHQPNPMYISREESEGVVSLEGSQPRREGDRLPGSYINFYIANGGVVVPQFGDPNDRPALQAFQDLFPGRRVVGLPGREILLGGGGFHCITLQQPEGYDKN